MPLQYFFLAAADVSGSIDRSTPLSERLELGGEVTALGLGTVFLILMLLWGVLTLFRLVFYTIPNRKKQTVEQKQAEIDIPDNFAGESTAETDEASGSDDGELVAAITAAVAEYLAAESSASSEPAASKGFRVVSFKRR